MSQHAPKSRMSQNSSQIFQTPEGVLSSEQGLYVAEIVRDKNVRQARGRMKMYDDGLEDVSFVKFSLNSTKNEGLGP